MQRFTSRAVMTFASPLRTASPSTGSQFQPLTTGTAMLPSVVIGTCRQAVPFLSVTTALASMTL